MKEISNDQLLNTLVTIHIKNSKGQPYWQDVIERAIEHHNEDTYSWYSQDKIEEITDFYDLNDWVIAYEFSRNLKKFFEKTWGDDCTSDPKKPPYKRFKEAKKRQLPKRLCCLHQQP